MVEKNNAGPGSGNQGSTQEQHIDAERRHENNPARQADSLSSQQPDSAPDAPVPSELQPTPVQQPDTRLNESHEPGSLSASEVEGGIPGHHTSAGRQSNKNDQND